MSIFAVLIFNIYGHKNVGRNVEVTYVLQYNHPEGSVENFGKKSFTAVCTEKEGDIIPYRGSKLSAC